MLVCQRGFIPAARGKPRHRFLDAMVYSDQGSRTMFFICFYVYSRIAVDLAFDNPDGAMPYLIQMLYDP